MKNSFSVQAGINTRDFTDRGVIIKYLIMRMCSVAKRRKIDGEPECWLSWMPFTVHYISQEAFISVLHNDLYLFNAHGLIMKHLNNKLLCVRTVKIIHRKYSCLRQSINYIFCVIHFLTVIRLLGLKSPQNHIHSKHMYESHTNDIWKHWYLASKAWALYFNSQNITSKTSFARIA